MDRRRRDLVATFMDALGGPSMVNELTQVTVRKAAELVVLAEATRAGMLNVVVTDIIGLIRIEGEARRACRSLGLKIEPVPPKTTPAGLLRARQRWKADEKAKAAQAAERAGEATAKDNTELPDAIRDE